MGGLLDRPWCNVQEAVGFAIDIVPCLGTLATGSGILALEPPSSSFAPVTRKTSYHVRIPRTLTGDNSSFSKEHAWRGDEDTGRAVTPKGARMRMK